MRACWVSRFNWTRDTEEETKARIREIMETLARNNFNAVLFQVRGEANTLYPSPHEPWGPQFNWTNPGWDPLAYAIEQARAQNLEFHAYFNTHTLSATVPPEQTTPQHQYNLHGPHTADPWVIHNDKGEPVSSTDSYTWLSPGHPDASAWTRKVLMHLVENYDVDGVHFDRIRTPGRGYSHDPRTVERFNGEGNPDGLDWGQFMRDQITNDLRRITGAIALRKPHIKITAAPFGINRRLEGGYQGTGTESYHQWYQDSFGWLERGVLDATFPMIYWRIGSAHPFEVLYADFLRNSGGRHVYAGISMRNDPIAQIEVVRDLGGPGTTMWSYGDGAFPGFLEGPYAEPAPIPPMPWKDEPTHAIVAGTITDEAGNPLLDAWIHVSGDTTTYLSGADGFYSLVQLQPGQQVLSFTKRGLGEVVQVVQLEAGEVREENITIPAGESPAGEGTDEATRLIAETIAMAVKGASILRPEYILSSLNARGHDKRVNEAFAAALSERSEDTRRALLRALELKFVHDPRTSTLDLLEKEAALEYRTFDWEPGDYPGGPEGPNEDKASAMVDALRSDEVLPERRANTGHDPVVRREEATEEVWEYILAQWEDIPGEEGRRLNRHAIESYVRMREQARAEGVELVIRSSHRDPQRAQESAARSGNPYAVASFSSHSLGLAIDFQMSQKGLSYSEISTRPMSEVIRMRESPVHKWIFLRGAEFGWYAYMHEPWHWEYNPPGFRPVFWQNFPGGDPTMRMQMTEATDRIADSIRAIESETGGDIAVAVRHLTYDMNIDHRSDEMFPAASVIKTHLLVILYRAAEKGELSLDEKMTLRDEDKVGGSGTLQGLPSGNEYTLAELARLMIVVSDNTATNMLVNRVGGMDRINADLASFGLERTRWNRLMMDLEARARGVENALYADETADLFAKLHRGELTDKPETTQAILDVLLAQELRGKMPALLPEGTRVAHKTGGLESISHDSGIIYAPTGPIAIAVLTKGIADEEISQSAIQRIAKAVYDEWGSGVKKEE
jgi:beta-lactamase class A